MADEPLSIETRLAAIETKLEAVLKSTEKTRTYTLWSVIVPLALLILPLLAIPLILPLLQTYLNTMSLPSGF